MAKKIQVASIGDFTLVLPPFPSTTASCESVELSDIEEVSETSPALLRIKNVLNCLFSVSKWTRVIYNSVQPMNNVIFLSIVGMGTSHFNPYTRLWFKPWQPSWKWPTTMVTVKLFIHSFSFMRHFLILLIRVPGQQTFPHHPNPYPNTIS